jgi:hypothetical protein
MTDTAVNAKIAAPNWAELAWVAFSISAVGKWGTVNSVGNLADPDFGLPAISSDAAPGWVRMDYSALATVLTRGAGVTLVPGFNCLVIPKSNLSLAATIRVKAGDAAFNADGTGGGTILYDSGTVNCFTQIVFPSGLLPWGHVNTWSGNPDPIMDYAYNRPAIVQFPNTVVAKYWEFLITDAANPDGFISLARLIHGPFYQPTVNFAYGATIDFAGERVADVTATNAEFIDSARKLKRVATLPLNDLTEDEAVAIFTALQMYLGYDKQGFLIFYPNDPYHMERRSFAFTLQRGGAIAYEYSGGNNVPLALQEVI